MAPRAPALPWLASRCPSRGARGGSLPPAMRAYLVATVASGLALALSLSLAGLSDGGPPLLFLTAVAVSGWYGGFGPALLVTAVGFVTLDFFFESPPYSLVVSDVRTPLNVAAFLVVSVLIGSLNARLRRAYQRASQAQRAAEAAVRVRDEALAVVSHDLRTPLTAIKTSVSTLRQPGAPLPDTTRGELLGMIEAEVDRLIRFAGDALAISRLDAGIAPDLQWNALGEVVSAVLDRSAPLLGDRPVAFDVPETLPLARFDASLLDQALSNLLHNVAAHTPAGAPVSITGRVDGGGVRLDVCDAGPGIPAEARERVFHRFERLGGAGDGAGLGLAIARAATEAQGGRLVVGDSPLGGACFSLRLPPAPGAGVCPAPGTERG